MPVHTLTAADALARLASFDAIIDARTEAEHALDHVPGALNWPTLNNQERIDIGTMYKQVNAFEAKKRGAALAARNIAAHIERHVIALPRDWKPLVYCWRGGNRSGSLATILGAIGFQVTLIEGGYKAWRAELVEDLPRLAPTFHYRVVCGPTGSGKTRLLHNLATQGAQVLDLEALACHRSSVLGHVPGQPQPSQKRFDSLIWAQLRAMDPSRVVYVECESKKVGNLRVPDALINAMRASPCIDVQLPDEARVALLMEDYAYFVKDRAHFIERLQALNDIRGKTVIERWSEWVLKGQTPAVVNELLRDHYDPVYRQSIDRNFVQYPKAQVFESKDHSPAAFEQMAQAILAAER
jgi:tRNA 2-selenouridine synthase